MKIHKQESVQTRKIVLTIIAGVFLVIIYVMIFMFSSDTGEDSSAISEKVTKWLVGVYYKIFPVEGTGEAITPVAYEWEGIVRKVAHFIEYMSIGFLSCGIAVMWMHRMKIMFAILMLQMFISAGLDELHQYFVPGRSASVRDVLLDVCGGTVGIIFLFILYKIGKCVSRRKRRAL